MTADARPAGARGPDTRCCCVPPAIAVLLDVSGPGLPRVLHWGADPGDAGRRAARALAAVPARRRVPHTALDAPWPLTLLPGQPDGWSGRPGLAGHRDGADLFPRLRDRRAAGR